MSCSTVLAAIQLQVNRQPDASAIHFISPSSNGGIQNFSYKDVWGRCCGIATVLHGQAVNHKRRTSAAETARGGDALNRNGAPKEAVQGEDWGPGAEGVVVLLVDEGPILPMLMLAVLLSKMVLVPLEPDEAPGRLSLVLSELLPDVVVVKDDSAREQLLTAVGAGGCEGRSGARASHCVILTVGEITQQAIAAKSQAGGNSICREGDIGHHTALPFGEAESTQVSHVCFTSGSSGRPKGCVVTHRALQAYSTAKIEAFSVTESSKVLIASPPSVSVYMCT